MTTLKLGWTNPLTGQFEAHPTLGPVLDLNDGTTFTLAAPDGLEMGLPPRTLALAGNVRAQGERGIRALYRHNRRLTARVLLGPMASTADLITTVRTLLTWVNAPPAVPICMRYQAPGASNPVYLDVVGAACDVPMDEGQWLRLQLEPVELVFIARPGLRGDRLTLQNLAWNPGFEQGSGPAVTAFSDGFATTNPYSVQAGGALGQDKLTYSDIIQGDGPVRYYRCDEASGTTANDAMGIGAGTLAGISAYGAAGGLTGDTDTALTLNGTSGILALASNTSLPSGVNAPASLEKLIKISANPSATAIIAELGDNTAGGRFYITLDTTGKLSAQMATNTPAGAAIALNTWHHVVATYDGTNLRLYLDGALYGGPTAATWTPSYGSSRYGSFGAASSGASWLTGSIDECAIYGYALSAAQVTAHYNAMHIAPATAASTLQIPAAGRIAFGSPNWGAVNLWQSRMRYVAGLTATYYLHRTDASNALYATITGTTVSLTQLVGGVANSLGSASMTLVPGARYWLQITQFPTVSGNPAEVQVLLLADNSGAAGAQIASVLAPTFDATTALSGAPQIAATGAALNLSGTHSVSLFGPGAWAFTGKQGTATGTASGGWDTSTTYPGGVVASSASARIDAGPSGTLDAQWNLYSGGTPGYGSGGTWPMPVASPGDSLGLSVYVLTSASLGAGATVTLLVTEYDASGTQLRQNTAATLTGPQTSWTALSAIGGSTYTTGASCAYVDLALRVRDTTTNSQGQTVWLDNIQVWDVTATGQASMPYCALRFPQSPAQLLVSGLVGDLPTPALLEAGTYLASWTTGSTLSFAVGRRAQASSGVSLCAPAVGLSGTGASPAVTPALDATAYGGYTLSATVTSGGWNPRSFSGNPASMLGTYHVWSRFKSAQSAPNLANVQQRAVIIQQGTAWFGKSDLSDLYGQSYGPWMSPLGASNTWTLCDAGQVAVPPFPMPGMADQTQTYVTPRAQCEDTTGGGSSCTINWQMLLPIDGSLLTGIANNPSNGPFTVTGKWLWLYADGLLMNRAAVSDGPAWAYSLEAGAQANPAKAVGGSGGAATGSINVNLGADPYLTLDPTVAIPSGASGVNQLVGVIADQNGSVLPWACDVVYTPLYLEPR